MKRSKILSRVFARRNYAQHVRWLKEIHPSEIEAFGWKAVFISDIAKNFHEDIHIPDGFAIPASTCLKILQDAGVKLGDVSIQDAILAQIRGNILQTELSKEIIAEIAEAHQKLEEKFGNDLTVAVRSSSIEKVDSLDASPYIEGYTRVRGLPELLDSCKKRISSWFLPQNMPFLLDESCQKIKCSLYIQRMVEGDNASSGLVYTESIETGHESILEIFSMFGVGGSQIIGDPDHWIVHKETLQTGFKPLLHRYFGKKNFHLGFNRKSAVLTIQKQHGKVYSLVDDDIFELGRIGSKLQDFFKKPIVVEFCKDSRDDLIYVVEVKYMYPIPRLFTKDHLSWHIMEDRGEDAQLIAQGKGMNERIVSGPVSRLMTPQDPFNDDTIIVCRSTSAEWNDLLKRSKGVVAEISSRFSHSYLEAQKLGIPLIEEPNALDLIFGPITMDGKTGKIYSGAVPFIVKKEDLTTLPKIRTKVMHTTETWADSFKNSFIPNDGVGILRIEGMIEHIGIHPLAFVHPEKIRPNDRKVLKALTSEYQTVQEMFVCRMAEYVGMVCAAYFPKPVQMRFSDFSEKGYQRLMGYEVFEVSEQNPLLGFRGTTRYINPKYVDAFALECKVVHRCRDIMGMKNLSVVIPFARTPPDVAAVIHLLGKHGLVQGPDFKIFMLCELPTHVVQADAFLDLVDGYIIETNDLISMILGIDKGNEIIRDIYHERNTSVKDTISSVIRKCKSRNKFVGICGEAPAKFQEFAEFLVEEEIDSIAMDPEKVIDAITLISGKEKFLNTILSRNPEETIGS
jgi:pyruvate,water dikinase